MLDFILYGICFTLWYFKLLQFVMKIIICGLPLENPIKLLKYAITIVDFKQNYVREKKLPTIVVGSPKILHNLCFALRHLCCNNKI